MKLHKEIKEKEFLSVVEVAFYLGVSKETIYRWIYNRKKSKFPIIRLGKQYRFLKPDVLNWAKNKELR